MTSSLPSSADSDTFADRRAYPRVAVALPAFLQASGTRHSVQMIDVSTGGAKLRCSAELAAGTAVILDCGTFVRGATVRWQTGQALGLSFDGELDARDVTALTERSIALAALMKSRG